MLPCRPLYPGTVLLDEGAKERSKLVKIWLYLDDKKHKYFDFSISRSAKTVATAAIFH